MIFLCSLVTPPLLTRRFRKQVDPVVSPVVTRSTRRPRPDKNRPRAEISMDTIVANMRSFLDELDAVYKSIKDPVSFLLARGGGGSCRA